MYDLDLYYHQLVWYNSHWIRNTISQRRWCIWCISYCWWYIWRNRYSLLCKRKTG